jgi:hypothetical protein
MVNDLCPMTHESTESGLSDPSGEMRLYLDRAEVLQATVGQLRKDLAQDEGSLQEPALGEETFELLRRQVAPILHELHSRGAHALQVAMYRVDIPEAHLHRTMARGGIDELAGETVLRCLQKVLTRLRHAGRY